MFLFIDHTPSDESFLKEVSVKDYHILESASTFIQLQRRTIFPNTILKQTASGWFLGYGNRKDGEFLEISLSTNGDVRIRRDSRATLPLHYSFVNGRFLLSDNYTTVVNNTPKLTLNEAKVVQALAPLAGGRKSTLWQEVETLANDEQLTLEKGKVQRTIYNPLVSSIPESNPLEFLPRLDEILQRTVDIYMKDQPLLGFQVSGGLDSPALPLFMKKEGVDVPWRGMSILFPGLRGATQAQKVRAIIEGSPHASIDFEHWKEISRDLGGHLIEKGELLPPSHHPAFFITRQKIEEYSKLGIRTLFHGHGGDELFGTWPSFEAQFAYGDFAVEHRLKQLPSYYTNHFKDAAYRAAFAKTDMQPPQLSTGIAHDAIEIGAHIDTGVWPVSPFMDAEFYQYCSGLKSKYRNEKNILRQYYEAKGFPWIIYKPFGNERDEGDIDNAMLTDDYEAIVVEYLEHSLLHQLGYIDAGSLLESYHAIKSGLKEADTNLYCLNFILNTEMNLHAARKNNQWSP